MSGLRVNVGDTNFAKVEHETFTSQASALVLVAARLLSAGAVSAADLLASLLATIGAATGAAVVTDAAGTVQQYLRGLVVLIGGSCFPDCSVAIASSKALVASTNVQSDQLPVGRYELWASTDIHFTQGATGAAAADAEDPQVVAGDKVGLRVDNTTSKGFLQIYPLGAGRYWIRGPL